MFPAQLHHRHSWNFCTAGTGFGFYWRKALSFAWSSVTDFPHILSSPEAKRDTDLIRFAILTGPFHAFFSLYPYWVWCYTTWTGLWSTATWDTSRLLLICWRWLRVCSMGRHFELIILKYYHCILKLKSVHYKFRCCFWLMSLMISLTDFWVFFFASCFQIFILMSC